MHRPDRPWEAPFEPLGAIALGLYYASYIGYYLAVTQLLHAGLDINAKGGKYGTALQAVSARGYEKVV